MRLRRLRIHGHLWLLGLAISATLAGISIFTVEVAPFVLDLEPARRHLRNMVWNELDSLPPVVGSTGVVVDQRVVVLGGEDASRKSLTLVRVLSTQAEHLTAPVELSHARAYAAAAALGRPGLLIIGGLALGQDESEEAVVGSTAELLDIDSATSTVSELPYAPYSGHTATALDERRVFVAGGEDNRGNTAMFDAETGTWKATAPLPHPRRGHTATLLDDGRIVVMGGVDHVTTDMASDVVAYDAASDAWQMLPSLNEPRTGHTATRLRDGRLLVAGGRNAAGARLSSAEIFDPTSGTWVPVSSLNVARSHHGAALLPDGRVAIIAGVDEHMGEIVVTEVYDPVDDTWTLGPELPSRRFDATYIAAEDGLFLVGGFGPGGLSDLCGTVFRLSY